jgi:ATP-binding cassette subfamily B protein
MRLSRKKGQGEDSRGTLPRLLAALRPESFLLAVVAVFSLVSVAFLVAGPAFLGQATNILFDGVVGKALPAGGTKAQAIAGLRAHGHGQLADMFSAMNFTPGIGVDFTRFGQVLGLAALVYALSSLFSWVQGYVMAGIVVRTVYRLREAVEEKLARLPLSYFDSHPHGDILSRVTNDIDNVSTTLQEGLVQLLTSVLTVLGILGLMFWISPLLAAVALVTIPLAIVVTSLIARRSKPRFAALWDRTGKLNGLVEESHTGHAVLLAFGQRQSTIDEFGRQNEQLRKTSFRAWFLPDVISPAVQFLANVNFVAIAALGAFQVVTGVITFGGAQAFIQYSRRFAIPVSQLAGQTSLIQSGLASAERVFGFLDAPEEAAIPGLPDGPDPGTAERPAAGLRVQLQHVSFRYDPDRPLIEDFTLDAPPGQTVAIVGPTGAGKTTIVNLLMRFYEIDSGHILLDGVDYRDLGRDQVRRCFGMVLQDTWLFAGTIRDNISYGQEDASDEEIVAAAKAAHVDDFVQTMPDGYATVIDSEASSISSGQKQMLTIARVFLANPAILILDEATSTVDTRTEVLIQDAMARLRSGRTSFVIAHRLSTVRDADTIVVMDAGRVVEQGSHQDLLRRGGFYRDIYNSQFAEAIEAEGSWPPRSRPKTSPGATPPAVVKAIVRLRTQLEPDNGADAIVAELEKLAAAQDWAARGLRVPHRSTVNKVLKREGLVKDQPAKLPRSSYRRFAYARPRDCYQIDATEVKLAGGQAAVVFDVLDDCTRLLAACRAADAETAAAAAAAITAAAQACGAPGLILCHNGMAFSGGPAAAAMGTRIIRSSPYHPQTCGKVERHHQTLKNWLATQPAPATLAGLQELLDAYRSYYNTRRHHTAVKTTPQHAWDDAGTYGGPGHLPRQDDATVHKLTVGSTGNIHLGPARIYLGRHRTGQVITAIRDHDHVTAYTPSGEPIGHIHLNHDKRHQGTITFAA